MVAISSWACQFSAWERLSSMQSQCKDYMKTTVRTERPKRALDGALGGFKYMCDFLIRTCATYWGLHRRGGLKSK